MRAKNWFLSVVAMQIAAAQAQSANDYMGYWRTQKGEAIMKMERCSLYLNAPATAACVKVAWHENAKNPDLSAPTDCNKRLAQFTKFQDGAWVGGQVFDPRNNGVYSGKLTMVNGQLVLRGYLFTESLGKSEFFSRVESIPDDCERRSK
jgi:uncharacterized protein (DUF2147 family)